MRGQNLMLIAALGLASCGGDRLTEAQSEVAGFCGTLLAVADGSTGQLGISIMRHAEELGFHEESFRAGVRRAVPLTEGGVSSPSAEEVEECREVLSW